MRRPASGKAARERGGMTAALTPLLDTLFLLLFSLLALSEARSTNAQEVRVQLPEVEPGPDARPTEHPVLTFEIGADSRIRLSSFEAPFASRAELDAALARELQDALPEEFVVEIRADREARHGTAVQLLQHLRVGGFVNVRLLATGAPETSDWLGEQAR